MTDQRLRELERRARETGSVEDQAAYLLARVRAGDLDEDRLHIAAYCGHEAALTALAGRQHAPPDFIPWAHGLRRWGNRIVLVASVPGVTASVAVLPLRLDYLVAPTLEEARRLCSLPSWEGVSLRGLVAASEQAWAGAHGVVGRATFKSVCLAVTALAEAATQGMIHALSYAADCLGESLARSRARREERGQAEVRRLASAAVIADCLSRHTR